MDKRYIQPEPDIWIHACVLETPGISITVHVQRGRTKRGNVKCPSRRRCLVVKCVCEALLALDLTRNLLELHGNSLNHM